MLPTGTMTRCTTHTPPAPARCVPLLSDLLEVIHQQRRERHTRAIALAASILHACGGPRAREVAQVTAHEALLEGKAASGRPSEWHTRGRPPVRSNPSDGHGGCHAPPIDDTGVLRDRDSLVPTDGIPHDKWRDLRDSFVDSSVAERASRHRFGVRGRDMRDPSHARASRRREELLASAVGATSHHLEPSWAAVELLNFVQMELTPGREYASPSHATLDAIRVLPAPVAGDLFVTCAARGDFDVILFYFEEGLPIDHVHTTFKYQALHAAVEFGHLDSARLLVAMGAKVDARGGSDDRSPLFLAALAKRWDVCSWLLGLGASKNVRDKRGLTAYQAMASSTDPEVAERAGMLTDPPQRVVSVTCRGITCSSLTLIWSEPLKSYEEEEFVGFLVEWRPMRARSICAAHSRHLAERVKPSRVGKRKKPRHVGQDGRASRPGTARETWSLSESILPSVSASVRRPNTGGGETLLDADGRGKSPPWHSRQVESYPVKLTGLYPATNYTIRVSTQSLAGFGVQSRETVLCTKVAPPSAPRPAPALMSATPNSITIGWVPPKYENGKPITRYEIQRLVLDQNHPDWDKGREPLATAAGTVDNVTAGTTATTTISSACNTDGGCTTSTTSSADVTPTTHTVTTSTRFRSSDRSIAADGGSVSHPEGLSLPSIEGRASDPAKGSTATGRSGMLGEDGKQVGVWIGQRTEKMHPYYTAAGLPTYCRALFRVRAGNEAGWGDWSPSSDALEAQDIIFPIKRGAVYMLLRWFNKPDVEVVRWELSRRVFKYGADFRGDEDESWMTCSQDVPGLREGESTFRCKGLMPGTEYQYRLRAFIDGTWQRREEAIVSSPFKTICSPPDAPRCPRALQLESDPLVAGGLVDVGSILAGSHQSVGSVPLITTPASTAGGLCAGSARGSGVMSAIARGEARAGAEAHEKSAGCADHHSYDDCITRAPRRRRARQRVAHGASDLTPRSVEAKLNVAKGSSERAPGECGDLEHTKGAVYGREDEEDEYNKRAATTGASTSMLLEWDAGCTNGAITTNYEVWGTAEAAEGPSAASRDWRLVATTEAAPAVMLSGLHQAQPYRFKVRARNALGWSDFGEATGPLVLNPLKSLAPPRLDKQGVTWLGLRLCEPAGAGLVLGFELLMCRWMPGMCEGEEEWTNTEGGKSIPTTLTLERSPMIWDLRPGAGYRFKTRAKTAFGWTPAGSPSDVFMTARRF